MSELSYLIYLKDESGRSFCDASFDVTRPLIVPDQQKQQAIRVLEGAGFSVAPVGDGMLRVSAPVTVFQQHFGDVRQLDQKHPVITTVPAHWQQWIAGVGKSLTPEYFP